ncbi:MAG: cupin domain-containing protein [Dehalococcoidia bacterium]|nr:cupin domain-containing protein [Dehalococcoidia bacterium]
MAEREAQRVKDTEAQPADFYEYNYKLASQARQRAIEGRVVIKGKEQPWQETRQGRLKFFLHMAMNDTALEGWRFFIHDVRTHSGRHRHQGGLAIYVLEGKGWTIVDGVRHDWAEGDLILLPLKPGGVEHQHFNAEPGAPCKWLALIYSAYVHALGNPMEQTAESPNWSSHA